MSGGRALAVLAALLGSATLAGACAAAPRGPARAALQPDSVVVVPDPVAWCGVTTPIVVDLAESDDEAGFHGGGMAAADGDSCAYVVRSQERTAEGARVVVETGSPLAPRRDTVHAVRGRRCRTTLARGGAVLAHLGSDPAAASAAPASCR